MLVTPPDLELFLTVYLRDALKAHGRNVQVGNKEPYAMVAPLSRPLVVVREDGGPATSAITYTRSCGISVLGGTRRNDKPTKDLARLCFAILTDPDIALADGSPIAAVNLSGATMPVTVAEPQDLTRAYFTVEYATVGVW